MVCILSFDLEHSVITFLNTTTRRTSVDGLERCRRCETLRQEAMLIRQSERWTNVGRFLGRVFADTLGFLAMRDLLDSLGWSWILPC